MCLKDTGVPVSSLAIEKIWWKRIKCACADCEFMNARAPIRAILSISIDEFK
jgi:hypothetical protein